LGAAYGVSGILRSVTALATQGRCLLPADVLAAHGLSPEAAIAAPSGQAVRDVLAVLAQEGRGLLAAGRRAGVPRRAIAAALPAVLARRDLSRWPAVVSPRGLGDRLAVLWAGTTGRI
jgi:phytoene synthase